MKQLIQNLCNVGDNFHIYCLNVSIIVLIVGPALIRQQGLLQL